MITANANLEDLVLINIQRCPGRKAREIARELKVKRRIVNQILYYDIPELVIRDANYRWRLRNVAPMEQTALHVNAPELSDAQLASAKRAWHSGRQRYAIIMERVVRQTALIEVDACDAAEAEEIAFSRVKDDECRWDTAGVDKAHLLHLQKVLLKSRSLTAES